MATPNFQRNRLSYLSRGLRRERGTMNKLEAAYAEALKLDEAVHSFWFEPLSLRLSHPGSGQPARYSPDFLVLYSDGTTCLDDVKGGFADDKASGVRTKTAAELFPLWKFRIVTKQAKKRGGGWKIVEV